MHEILLRVRRTYSRFLYFAAAAAGMITFAMMWLIDVNALSRKIFNTPVPAGVELTQSMLTVAIMLPFGYVLFRREHVNTVFLISKLPRHVDRWLYIFWMGVGCLVFAAVTYGTFKFGLRSYVMNEQVWGANVRFPLYPAKFAVALGTALLSIQFLLDALLALLDADHGEQSGTAAQQEMGQAHV